MATWLQLNRPNSNSSFSNLTVFGEISGSTLLFSNITGSLYGTSSYSIVSETASYSKNSTSSSFAITAAYALNIVSNTFPYTGSAEISGSLTVIGPVISTTGYTGFLFGTSSWANNVVSSSYAITASQAINSISASQSQNSISASYVLSALSASFAASSSQSQNAVTASYVFNSISSSFAATASSADNLTVRGTLTAQTIVVQTITSSIDIVTGSTQFGTLFTNTHIFTGSVRMTGSLSAVNATITGSLFGTSSWSNNTISSSQAQNAVTASYVFNSISSSYSLSSSQAQNSTTASYSLNTLSASFATSSSISVTSSYSLITVSSSIAVSSSFATSASQAINAVTASYVLNAVSSSVSLTSSRVTGGSNSYIPIWNSSNILSSSILYQSASNIGVDMTNPLYKLHIKEGTGGISVFQQDSKHALVTNAYIVGSEYHYGPGTVYGFIYAHAAGLHVRSMDNVSLILGTNNIERARITGDGFTGFGTTVPTARLHISGAVSERLLLVSSSSGPALFVSGNRSVGIGITSPSLYGGHQTLHIGGAESGRGLIEFGRGGANNGPLIYSNNDDSLAIYGNSGVSIGSKLDVIGNTIVSGTLKVSNNNYALTINSDGNGPFLDPGDRSITIRGQSNAGYIYCGTFFSIARWGFNTTDIQNHVVNINGSLNHLREYNRRTTDYTLALSDAGKVVEMNSSSTNTVTIPSNSSVAFPSGSFIDIVQEGTGQTSFVTGSGVVIRSKEGKLKIEAQYGVATLLKKGGDEWYLYGDIIA